MKRLLNDHERRRYMGDAGRRAVEAKYTWNIIGKQMLDVYTDILADRDAALVSDKHLELSA
jgi:glycosyltransferase involved in cell wall biosynthesis